MADWVLAVERAYVSVATGGASGRRIDESVRIRATAAIGAVASRYLAVGTPRSLGLIIDVFGEAAGAAESLVAHRTWFAPRDIRCACLGSGDSELAALTGGRGVSVDEALAADIVCVHGYYTNCTVIDPMRLRRGTHLNLLCYSPVVRPELASVATVFHEHPDLPALAAGLVDGRQLDELTVFMIGDAEIAMGTLA